MNKSKALICVIAVLKKIVSIANTINKTMLLKSRNLEFLSLMSLDAAFSIKNGISLRIIIKISATTV
jgi:hypothetical protein